MHQRSSGKETPNLGNLDWGKGGSVGAIVTSKVDRYGGVH